jgi:hypothetical protein
VPRGYYVSAKEVLSGEIMDRGGVPRVGYCVGDCVLAKFVAVSDLCECTKMDAVRITDIGRRRLVSRLYSARSGVGAGR